MSRPPIPNLPPLSSVQDHAVRAYLQALTNGWKVRNGEDGDNLERFVTVRDLKDGAERVRLAQGGAAGGGYAVGAFGVAPVTPGSGPIGAAINALVDSIKQSKLFVSLGERLAKIETPEWFRDRFGAEVQTTIVKVQSDIDAQARQTTTAITNINGNIALVQTEIEATSTLVDATVSQVTTLQTEVGQSLAVAQQALTLAQNVDGQVDGAWTVKFDVNGYVTGAGLGVSGKGGAYSSEFIIRADRFALTSPLRPQDMADANVPFIVTTTPTVINGFTYPPGTWIKAAYIADASIDTLKVAGNAVSTTRSVATNSGEHYQMAADGVTTLVATYPDGVIASGTAKARKVATVAFTFTVLPQAVQVIAVLNVINGSGALTNITLTLDRTIGETTTQLNQKTVNAPDGLTLDHTYIHLDSPTDVGTVTYDLWVGNNAAAGAWTAAEIGLIALATLR